MELPKFQMPSEGCDVKVAYQLLHDELLLGEWERIQAERRPADQGEADGNPNMNLASCVSSLIKVDKR